MSSIKKFIEREKNVFSMLMDHCVVVYTQVFPRASMTLWGHCAVWLKLSLVKEVQKLQSKA